MKKFKKYLKKYFNPKYIDIKRDQFPPTADNESKDSWTSPLMAHLNNQYIKKAQKQTLIKSLITIIVVLLLSFSSLIFVSSINEMKAGKFNLYDAVVKIGKNIFVIRSGGRQPAPADITPYTPIKGEYNSIGEFFSANPGIKCILPEYLPDGYELYDIHYKNNPTGYNLEFYYFNKKGLSLVSIESHYLAAFTQWSTGTVYPGAQIEEFKVSDINVLFITLVDQNIAKFFMDDFLIKITSNISKDEFIKIIEGLQ